MTRPQPNLLALWGRVQGYVYFLKVLLMILMCSLDEALLLKVLCPELGIASVASLVPSLPTSLYPPPFCHYFPRVPTCLAPESSRVVTVRGRSRPKVNL